MEMVEQAGSDYQSIPPSAVDREYAAFVYGVEWGNSAQYGDGGYDRDELPGAYKEWVEGGRKSLYEETVVENIGSSETVGGPYTAAKLYLSHPGLVKPALAKELSEQTGIDYDIAVLMIDAIDAYEDIREAPEVWETSVKEENDPHKSAEIDAEAYHNSKPDSSEIEELKNALRPLGKLDLTGVRGDIVYQRDNTFILVKDVIRARELLLMKIDEDRQYRRDQADLVASNEGEIKKAFLAGYQEGESAGFNDATDRGTNETPEEAYEYWMKYDR